MTTKLTPYQNKAITEALCDLLINGSYAPEYLKDARRALVTECEAINQETDQSSLDILHSVQ